MGFSLVLIMFLSYSGCPRRQTCLGGCWIVVGPLQAAEERWRSGVDPNMSFVSDAWVRWGKCKAAVNVKDTFIHVAHVLKLGVTVGWSYCV